VAPTRARALLEPFRAALQRRAADALRVDQDFKGITHLKIFIVFFKIIFINFF